MNDDVMKAMVRQYMLEPIASRHLSDEERINHIVQEMKHLIARRYGFNTASEMDMILLNPVHRVSNIQRTSSEKERRTR